MGAVGGLFQKLSAFCRIQYVSSVTHHGADVVGYETGA